MNLTAFSATLKRAACAVALLGTLALTSRGAGAAETPSLIVTTTTDVTSTTDNLTSLREAITYANSNADVSAITFDPTVFATAKTITVSAALPDISQPLSITGSSAGVTVAAASKTFYLFSINSGISATLDRLTISTAYYGIYNLGTSTFTNCNFNGNDIGIFIQYDGTTVTNCTFSGNTTGIDNNGTPAITNCTFSGNANGIRNNSIANPIITSCNFINNTIYGINNNATTNITNCTLYGNATGIYNNNAKTVNATNCTISGNTTGLNTIGTGITVFKNTILVSNTTNLSGTALNAASSTNITSGSANGAGLETSDGADVVIFKNNGGPMSTIALVKAGAAIDGGTNASISATTDQRGPAYPRIQGARVDIGAYEAPPFVRINNVTQTEGNSGVTNFVFTVTLSGTAATAATVNYSVGGGTATAGTDYGTATDSDGGTPGVLTIAVGATSGTITVPVNGDTTIEPTKTFNVTLSNPSNALLGTPSVGLGTITADDFEASSLVVNTTGDAVNNLDNVTSLREAITYANSNADVSAITFDPTVFAGAQTISASTALPAISQPLSINGPSVGVTVAATSKTFDLFTLNASISASFDRLTFSNATAGITSAGNPTLTNCTVSGNTSGLSNASGRTANVTNCTFSGNTNYGFISLGTAIVTNSTFSSNASSGFYNNSGQDNITNCTFSGNGNGIYNFGTSTVTNSTFTGNTTGINNNFQISTVINCTISGNTTGLINSATAVLKNTILVSNTTNQTGTALNAASSTNITAGTADAAGLETSSGSAVLKNNGGPTATIALVKAGAAIDGGTNASISATTDQRGPGYPRVQGVKVDIGAYEAPPALSINSVTLAEGNSGVTNFVFTVTLSGTSSTASTVNYSVGGGTATSGTDYGTATDSDGGTPGVLTIAAGATSGTITVPVNGDTALESTETFNVTLSSPSGVLLSAASVGVGTITTDDIEPGSLVVNITADTTNNTDGLTSLREAIVFANSNADVSAITFDPTVFAAAQTVSVSSALPAISQPLSITGSTAGVTIAAAAKTFTLFAVSTNINATFDRLTLSGASTGISSSGTLTVTNGTFISNTYGIKNNSGTATVTSCNFITNSNTGFANNSGTSTVTNCTFNTNFGTGFDNFDTATVTNCSFTNNYVGMNNYATATTTNCTFTGNTYGFGGSGSGTSTFSNCTFRSTSNYAIYNNGTTALTNCTLSSNGIGISNAAAGTVNATNCTISGNTTGLNNVGTGIAIFKNTLLVGNTTNLTGTALDATSSSNITSGTADAAGLETSSGAVVLKNNGGPTATIALVKIGTAVNTGSNASIPSGVTTDQRDIGFPRTLGGTVDIGAYESSFSSVSIGNASSPEGNTSTPVPLNFTVTLTAPATSAVTVNYATSNDTAIAGSDYTATSGTLTIAAGDTTGSITVPVLGDNTFEPDETFNVTLSSPIGVTLGSPSVGLGTITNDEVESASLVVTTSSDASTSTDGLTSLREAITFANSTANQSAITFDPTVFATAKTITLASALPDIATPLTLTGPTAGVTVGAAASSSGFPVMTVTSAATAGLDRLTITGGKVGIDSFGTITVTNSTISGSATYGIYSRSGSTATVSNSTLSQHGFDGLLNYGTVTVTNSTFSGNVYGFYKYSGSASVTNCTSSGNSGYGITNYSGTLTLKNSLSVGNGNSSVGTLASGSTNNLTSGTADAAGLQTNGGANAVVLQNNGGPTPTIALVKVGTALNAGSNAAVSAFTTDQRGTGYPRIKGGTVDIGAYEALPLLSVTNPSGLEGNTSTPVTLNFVVSLGGPATSPVTVNYATANGTAIAGTDYTTTSGTLTFAVGESSKTITVPMLGETMNEADETLSLNLSAPTGAILADNTVATGTIRNDDSVPTITLRGVTQSEGDAGTSTFGFKVLLSNPSSSAISVDYATADDTATAPDDYTTLSGTLTIPAGNTSGFINVTVNGDTATESDERFNLNLTNPLGATLQNGVATLTARGNIVNDDADVTPTATNVTAQTTVYKSGLARNRTTGRYVMSLVIQNNGASLDGPLYVALDGLSPNLNLYNADGFTNRALPAGSPYRTLVLPGISASKPNGVLAAGTALTVSIEIVNPNNEAITFTPRVLQGPGAP